MQLSPSAHRHLDKKRTFILLRSVVIISVSYLVLFGAAGRSVATISYIGMLLLSTLALTLIPAEWFYNETFSVGWLLLDTGAVLAGLYLTAGCFSPDFLLIYFFTIFLTTATEHLAQIAIAATLVSGLYGYWLWVSSTHVLTAAEWLRLPFFFIVAVFYAYATEETKENKRRRQYVECEADRLRFLLHLGNAFSQRTAGKQLIKQAASLVEMAFPHVICHVKSDGTPNVGNATRTFPVSAQEKTFGALQVRATDGHALGTDVQQFCQLVAVFTANALYAADQVSEAADGARLKEEFLGTISHELRTPLHAILGNADIVSEEMSRLSPVAAESLHRLRASGCRLLHLIEEMICLAELRAGKSPSVCLEPVDLHELFEQLTAGVREQLAARPVSVEWEIAREVVEPRTDRRKLQVILTALLGNAVKFTERGFIRFSALQPETGMLEIAVSDSGIGIDKEHLGVIFQVFRQIDGSLKRRFEGLGVGLALAQDLALALGGQLDVESEPGHGSTFRVRLPLREPPAVQKRGCVPLLAPASRSLRQASPVRS